MRAVFFFVFYIFIISMIVACGTANEPNLPLSEEPNQHEQSSEYPTVTPYGVITYKYLGTVDGDCNDSDSKD